MPWLKKLDGVALSQVAPMFDLYKPEPTYHHGQAPPRASRHA
jgi:hypothetical protein